MSRKGQGWQSGSELREYVQAHFPGCDVVTRKTTNRYAILFDRKTGRVRAHAESNSQLVELLTRPDGAVEMPKRGFHVVTPTDFSVSRKTLVQNAVNTALDGLAELRELATLRPTVSFDADGWPVGIKVGNAILKRS